MTTKTMKCFALLLHLFACGCNTQKQPQTECVSFLGKNVIVQLTKNEFKNYIDTFGKSKYACKKLFQSALNRKRV